MAGRQRLYSQKAVASSTMRGTSLRIHQTESVSTKDKLRKSQMCVKKATI